MDPKNEVLRNFVDIFMLWFMVNNFIMVLWLCSGFRNEAPIK